MKNKKVISIGLISVIFMIAVYLVLNNNLTLLFTSIFNTSGDIEPTQVDGDNYYDNFFNIEIRGDKILNPVQNSLEVSIFRNQGANIRLDERDDKFVSGYISFLLECTLADRSMCRDMREDFLSYGDMTDYLTESFRNYFDISSSRVYDFIYSPRGQVGGPVIKRLFVYPYKTSERNILFDERDSEYMVENFRLTLSGSTMPVAQIFSIGVKSFCMTTNYKNIYLSYEVKDDNTRENHTSLINTDGQNPTCKDPKTLIENEDPENIYLLE